MVSKYTKVRESLKRGWGFATYVKRGESIEIHPNLAVAYGVPKALVHSSKYGYMPMSYERRSWYENFAKGRS